MATAAPPAAGSGSGSNPAGAGAPPAGSPSSSPASPSGGASSIPVVPSSSSSQAPSRPIRPIQDRTDNDRMSAVERRKLKIKDAAKTPAERAAEAKNPTPDAKQDGQGQEGRVRDADGRFVAVSGAEELRGNKTALEARKEKIAAERLGLKPPVKIPAQATTPTSTPASEAAPDVPDGPTSDGKFALGGKVYATAADAGQAHRSLQGIHRSMETTTKKAAELSRGWAEAYERDVTRLRAEVVRLTSGSGGATSPGQSPTPNTPAAASAQTQQGATSTPGVLEPFSKSMDWKNFHQLYNSAEFGPTGAQIFLSQQLDTYFGKMVSSLKAEISDTFKKDLDPLRSTSDMVQKRVQAQAALDGARTLWSQVAQATDPQTGEAYYPELAQDPKLIEEILPIWLSLDPNYGMTDSGVFSAYLQWKHWRGARTSRQTEAGQTAAEIVSTLQQAGNAGARAVVSQSPTPGIPSAPSTPAATRTAREKSVIDGIRAAKSSFTTSSGLNLGRMNR